MSAPVAVAVARWIPRDRVWSLRVARCPYCRREHFHGGGSGPEPDAGHRVAHCHPDTRIAGYIIVVPSVAGAA